ncbi:hypothetical protein [Streptomyces sp. NBC_01589]
MVLPEPWPQAEVAAEDFDVAVLLIDVAARIQSCSTLSGFVERNGG